MKNKNGPAEVEGGKKEQQKKTHIPAYICTYSIYGMHTENQKSIAWYFKEKKRKITRESKADIKYIYIYILYTNTHTLTLTNKHNQPIQKEKKGKKNTHTHSTKSTKKKRKKII